MPYENNHFGNILSPPDCGEEIKRNEAIKRENIFVRYAAFMHQSLVIGIN